MWQTVRRQRNNSKVSPQGVEMICRPPRQFNGGISFCCQSGHLSMVPEIAVDVQNKIPHRRICNISATSGLILKILEAA